MITDNVCSCANRGGLLLSKRNEGGQAPFVGSRRRPRANAFS